MDAYEMNVWRAKFRLQRIGDEWNDKWFGEVAAAAGNAGRLAAKAQNMTLRGGDCRPDDFFPPARIAKPDRAALRTKMRAFVACMGATLGG